MGNLTAIGRSFSDCSGAQDKFLLCRSCAPGSMERFLTIAPKKSGRCFSFQPPTWCNVGPPEILVRPRCIGVLGIHLNFSVGFPQRLSTISRDRFESKRVKEQWSLGS